MKIRVICLLLFLAGVSHAQTVDIDGVDARSNPAEFAKQLSSLDANVRRRSAEALARLAATEQRKLVEGYQLQEKNKEVRLALDWALYRMGRSEALYRVVKDLDSGRQDQAIGYLAELESPDLLYPFLKRQTNAARVNAGLLKALARIGDARSEEHTSELQSLAYLVCRLLLEKKKKKEEKKAQNKIT